MRCKKKAFNKVKRNLSSLVLLIDRSKLDQNQVTTTIWWKDNYQIKRKTAFLRLNKKIVDVEIWAILEALDIANKITTIRNKLVIICFDLQKALNLIVFPSIYQEY